MRALSGLSWGGTRRGWPDANATGLDLANAVRARFPALPTILLCGYDDVGNGDEAGFMLLRKTVPLLELPRRSSLRLEHAAAREQIAPRS